MYFLLNGRTRSFYGKCYASNGTVSTAAVAAKNLLPPHIHCAFSDFSERLKWQSNKAMCVVHHFIYFLCIFRYILFSFEIWWPNFFFLSYHSHCRCPLSISQSNFIHMWQFSYVCHAKLSVRHRLPILPIVLYEHAIRLLKKGCQPMPCIHYIRTPHTQRDINAKNTYTNNNSHSTTNRENVKYMSTRT